MKQSSLHTIVVDFGPAVPNFQQHFTDPKRAGEALRVLISKMTKTAGGCIEGLQMWHRGAMISSYRANPPKPVWIPPRDADGIRRIPEAGIRGKQPKRLPATAPASPKFKIVL